MDVLNIKKLDLTTAENLSSEDKKYIMYRGQKAEITSEPPASKNTAAKSSTLMYRGQKVSG
jgi:hypothetical protein